MKTALLSLAVAAAALVGSDSPAAAQDDSYVSVSFSYSSGSYAPAYSYQPVVVTPVYRQVYTPVYTPVYTTPVYYTQPVYYTAPVYYAQPAYYPAYPSHCQPRRTYWHHRRF